MGGLSCKIIICGQKRARQGKPLAEKVASAAYAICEIIQFRDTARLLYPVDEDRKAEIIAVFERQIEEVKAVENDNDQAAKLKPILKAHLKELDEIGMSLV